MKPQTYYQLRVDEEAAKAEALRKTFNSFSHSVILSDPGDEAEQSYII